jgi:hypothetical protein
VYLSPLLQASAPSACTVKLELPRRPPHSITTMAPDRRPHASMKRGQDSRSLASLSSVSQPSRSTSSVRCLASPHTTRR